jgi:hypothetical protein
VGYDLEFLIPIAAFVMTGYMVKVFVDAFRRSRQMKLAAEFHTKLLDRIGSAEEFGRLLQTEGGQRFIESITIERQDPLGRVTGSLQTGIVMTAFSLGLMYLAGRVSQGNEGFSILGVLFLTLGVGFIVSAVSAYVLARNHGVIATPVSSR